MNARLQKLKARRVNLLDKRRRIAPLADSLLEDIRSPFWTSTSQQVVDAVLLDAYCGWKGTENEISFLETDLKFIFKHSSDDLAFIQAAKTSQTGQLALNLIEKREALLKSKKDTINTLWYTYGVQGNLTSF